MWQNVGEQKFNGQMADDSEPDSGYRTQVFKFSDGTSCPAPSHGSFRVLVLPVQPAAAPSRAGRQVPGLLRCNLAGWTSSSRSSSAPGPSRWTRTTPQPRRRVPVAGLGRGARHSDTRAGRAWKRATRTDNLNDSDRIQVRARVRATPWAAGQGMRAAPASSGPTLRTNQGPLYHTKYNVRDAGHGSC